MRPKQWRLREFVNELFDGINDLWRENQIGQATLCRDGVNQFGHALRKCVVVQLGGGRVW